jgi:hypothetical protein
LRENECARSHAGRRDLNNHPVPMPTNAHHALPLIPESPEYTRIVPRLQTAAFGNLQCADAAHTSAASGNVIYEIRRYKHIIHSFVKFCTCVHRRRNPTFTSVGNEVANQKEHFLPSRKMKGSTDLGDWASRRESRDARFEGSRKTHPRCGRAMRSSVTVGVSSPAEQHDSLQPKSEINPRPGRRKRSERS